MIINNSAKRKRSKLNFSTNKHLLILRFKINFYGAGNARQSARNLARRQKIVGWYAKREKVNFLRISLLGAGEISILTTRIPSVTQDFSLRHASSCCRLLFLLVPRGKPFMSADLKRIFLYFFEAEGGKSLKFSSLRITDRYCDFNELKPFRRGSLVVNRIINFYGEISRAAKYSLNPPNFSLEIKTIFARGKL